MSKARRAFQVTSDGTALQTEPIADDDALFHHDSPAASSLIRQHHWHATVPPAISLQHTQAVALSGNLQPLLLLTVGAAGESKETTQGLAGALIVGLICGIIMTVIVVGAVMYTTGDNSMLGGVLGRLGRRNFSRLPSRTQDDDAGEFHASAIWDSDEEKFNADVDSKDDSFYACKLNKLNEDSFDDPGDEKNWRMREIWIGSRGALHYFSKLHNHVVSFFDGEPVDRLDIKRCCIASSSFPHCVSVGVLPSDNPEEDPNPTIFGTDCEDDLIAFMTACRNYSQLQEHKRESVFTCRLLKYDNRAGKDGQKKQSNWKTRDMWVTPEGIACYWSLQSGSVAAIGDGVGVAHIDFERIPEEEAGRPLVFTMTSGASPTKSKRRREPNLWAAPDAKTLETLFAFKEQVESGHMTVMRAFSG